MLNQRLKNRYNYNVFNIAYTNCGIYLYAKVFLLFMIPTFMIPNKYNLHFFSAYCIFNSSKLYRFHNFQSKKINDFTHRIASTPFQTPPLAPTYH